MRKVARGVKLNEIVADTVQAGIIWRELGCRAPVNVDRRSGTKRYLKGRPILRGNVIWSSPAVTTWPAHMKRTIVHPLLPPFLTLKPPFSPALVGIPPKGT